MEKIEVLGIPFGKGGPIPGVEKAPERFREAYLLKSLADQGYDVTDHGDVELKDVVNDPPQCNVKHPLTIGGDMKRVSDRVYEVTKTNPGALCLNLGGDRAISLGTIHGHMRANPNAVVVWVDAHADINPPAAYTSGNIHSMPLSFLVHEMQPHMPEVPGFEWLKPCLHAKDLVYIGMRAVRPAEKKVIKDLAISHYDMHQVDQVGIHEVMARVLQTVNPRLDRPIHLSMDIDAFDPVFAPCTGVPVSGGLTVREGIYIVETLKQTGRLVNFDLVEVNPMLPALDPDSDLVNATNPDLVDYVRRLRQEELVKVTVRSACDIVLQGLGGRKVNNPPRATNPPTLE